jgi:hypothetical protein
MYYLYFHLICVVYCFWRLIIRYWKTIEDGAVNVTPALDSIMVLMLAPALAIVDVSITWYEMTRDYYFKKRKDREVL